MLLANYRTSQAQTRETADARQQSYYDVHLPNIFTRLHWVKNSGCVRDFVSEWGHAVNVFLYLVKDFVLHRVYHSFLIWMLGHREVWSLNKQCPKLVDINSIRKKEWQNWVGHTHYSRVTKLNVTNFIKELHQTAYVSGSDGFIITSFFVCVLWMDNKTTVV